MSHPLRSAIVVCLLSAAAFAQAPVEWRLSEPLTAAERAAVLSLAARSGVPAAAAVSSDMIALPIGCRVLRVDSVVSRTGDRIRSRQIWIRHRNWDPHGCDLAKASRVRGDWIVEETTSHEGWRIRDGDAYVDLDASEAVPYRDAERIVLAIKRRQLVNKLTDPKQGMPDLAIWSVRGIAKRGPTPLTYEVSLGGGGGGMNLSVVLADDRVELRAWSQYMI